VWVNLFTGGDVMATTKIDNAENALLLSQTLFCQLGCHKIYNADSRDRNLIEQLMFNNGVDVIVFDPPYEINGIFEHIPEPHKGMALVLFYDYKYFAVANYNAMLKGWKPQFELIWDCCGSVIEDNRPLNSHKACAVYGEFVFDNKTAIVENATRTQRDAEGRLRSIEKFRQSEILKKYGHKHAKPHEWLKAIFSGIGGNVYLDMFAGSGSTLLVGLETGIKTILIEKEREQCQCIVENYNRKLTGEI
jgi:16S rRNA G966 N2-methylase RsmD